MRRVSYIGDKPGTGSGIPIQAEAATYFSAMTAAPSAAFKDAINRAIYRWKSVGVWANVTHLWLLCAETSQASLLNMTGGTGAAVGGAPTFATGKGYSGFSTTNGLAFPVASSSINMFAFVAGLFDQVSGDAIVAAGGGTASNIPGTFGINSSTARVVSGMGATGTDSRPPYVSTAASPIITGGGGLWLYGPSYVAVVGGSAGSTSTNYGTAAVTPHPLNRLCAYGHLAASSTHQQRSKFLTILADLLESLGALD